VESSDGRQHPGRMSLGERRAIGLALAQGFKYAANCRTTAYTNSLGRVAAGSRPIHLYPD